MSRVANTRRNVKRGRPAQAELAAKNAQIRNAALAVFAEKGFEGASIVEIAARAGVTRRTLYARYANKIEVFAAAVSGLTDERWPVHDPGGVESAERLLFDIAADLTIRSPSAALLLRIVISEGTKLPGLETTVRTAGREHLLRELKATSRDSSRSSATSTTGS